MCLVWGYITQTIERYGGKAFVFINYYVFVSVLFLSRGSPPVKEESRRNLSWRLVFGEDSLSPRNSSRQNLTRIFVVLDSGYWSDFSSFDR